MNERMTITANQENQEDQWKRRATLLTLFARENFFKIFLTQKIL